MLKINKITLKFSKQKCSLLLPHQMLEKLLIICNITSKTERKIRKILFIAFQMHKTTREQRLHYWSLSFPCNGVNVSKVKHDPPYCKCMVSIFFFFFTNLRIEKSQSSIMKMIITISFGLILVSRYLLWSSVKSSGEQDTMIPSLVRFDPFLISSTSVITSKQHQPRLYLCLYMIKIVNVGCLHPITLHSF